MNEEKKYATVVITRKEGVATVTMNRPDKLNALSPELMVDLRDAMDEVGNDVTVRAVLLTGAGRAFSAGGDVLKDILPLRDMSPTEFNSYMEPVAVMYEVIMDMEKPVIAAINGHAVGAGLDLTMACDIRIAAEDAQLGEFFVRMGLIPEAAVCLLPRIVGPGKAKLMSFTGDLMTARQAEQIGLVDIVVPPDKLMSTAEELATRLANGPIAIGIIKKGINESFKMDLATSMDYIQRLQYQLVHTEDHKEAVAAYLEKRKPVFRGK